MNRNCYTCERKTECYTESGLEKLKPDDDSDCGALFTNYDEAVELIHIIGEAIGKRSEYVQKQIIEYVANKYNVPEYNVMTELFY